MLGSGLKHSLFYLLVNYHHLSLEKLVFALRYQVSRAQNLSLSFSQILIAFNLVHHQLLEDLSREFGELDNDPLGHLLVDSGRISIEQLQRLRAQNPAPGGSLVPLLKQNLAYEIQALLQELEVICSLKQPSILQLLQKRQLAISLFKQRLWDSGWLEPGCYKTLGLDKLDYLPLRFKPLLDLLVMSGDYPEYLQSALLVEYVDFVDEPLLRLLCRPGLVESSVFSRLIYSYHHQNSQPAPLSKNPAVLLVSEELISRHLIRHAIQQAYQSFAKHEVP